VLIKEYYDSGVGFIALEKKQWHLCCDYLKQQNESDGDQSDLL